VDAVGDGVTEFAEGDRVFGLIRFPHAGSAYADYVVAPAAELVATPAHLDDAHAASIPLSALTAWKAIVEEGAVEAGDRVLIHAAGGGVGHFAVQIAKARGAHVIATASAGKSEFVRSLGADEVIDYAAGDFSAGLKPVDLAIDSLGGGVTAATIAVVRDGGALVSLLPGNEDAVRAEAERRGITHTTIFVGPNRTALTELAALVADGVVTPTVSATFPLEQAGEAHLELGRAPRGKVVLLTSRDSSAA
jgi:NADPH:quinone reductase-like Zn-dependent oxidoreductase